MHSHTSCQQAKHVKLHSNLIQPSNREPLIALGSQRSKGTPFSTSAGTPTARTRRWRYHAIHVHRKLGSMYTFLEMTPVLRETISVTAHNFYVRGYPTTRTRRWKCRAIQVHRNPSSTVFFDTSPQRSTRSHSEEFQRPRVPHRRRTSKLVTSMEPGASPRAGCRCEAASVHRWSWVEVLMAAGSVIKLAWLQVHCGVTVGGGPIQ